MWRRRRKGEERAGGAAVVERPPEAAAAVAQLRAEIARLTAANRARRDVATERRLLRLRHRAGIGLLDVGGAAPAFPAPEPDRLGPSDRLPELAPDALTPGLLRAAILRDGCLLVRGLVERAAALALAGGIDRAFAERERHAAGAPAARIDRDPGIDRERHAAGATAAADGYYEEFAPEPRFGPVAVRPWIELGGGVLAADAPRLSFEMLELFEAAGVPALVEGYLGESPLLSVHKTTLRKAQPAVPGAWHQDGSFMGHVRSLNLWLALSRCGADAPGLDLVPRRLERFVHTPTGDAMDIVVSQAAAERAAGDRPIVRPLFEPGDALLFDEMFLHQTASDPAMPNPRFAVECWFFGGSAFPHEYAPLAL